MLLQKEGCNVLAAEYSVPGNFLFSSYSKYYYQQFLITPTNSTLMYAPIASPLLRVALGFKLVKKKKKKRKKSLSKLVIK